MYMAASKSDRVQLDRVGLSAATHWWLHSNKLADKAEARPVRGARIGRQSEESEYCDGEQSGLAVAEVTFERVIWSIRQSGVRKPRRRKVPRVISLPSNICWKRYFTRRGGEEGDQVYD